MTILDRYLGKRLVLTLLKTLFALVLLVILIDLLTRRRVAILRNEVPWNVVGLYYLAYIPQILSRFQMAPLAMLVSALLVLGNMAQNNEVTAALAGGISLRKIVFMPVVVALAFAGVMFHVQDTIGPPAARVAGKIEAGYLSKGTRNERHGMSWANLSGQWTCHVMKFNRAALTGEGILMHSIREEAVQQIQARRMYWDETLNRWTLENGRWFVFSPGEKGWGAQVNRITQWPAPIAETPDQLFSLEDSPDTKSLVTLAADIARAEHYGVPTDFQRTEYHAKFALPALCFVMVWLAIPFAMRLRRGGVAIGFVISIGIALAYMILFRVSMGLGHLGRISPPLAAWFANAVFFVLGLILFRRTPT